MLNKQQACGVLVVWKLAAYVQVRPHIQEQRDAVRPFFQGCQQAGHSAHDLRVAAHTLDQETVQLRQGQSGREGQRRGIDSRLPQLVAQAPPQGFAFAARRQELPKDRAVVFGGDQPRPG